MREELNLLRGQERLNLSVGICSINAAALKAAVSGH